MGMNIMLQGELCGENIQSNRMQLEGQQLFIYDIFNINEFRYLSPAERFNIMWNLNDMPGDAIHHVPIVETFKVFDRFSTYQELQEWVQNVKGLNGTAPEGVVFKSTKPVNKEIISFKVINNKYLLKHEE